MKLISFIELLCLMFLLSPFCNIKAQTTSASNVAYQDKQVRITLITDGAVRLEWAPEGTFVDNASFVAVNRQNPPVAFKVKNSGKTVEVSTAKMVLKYLKNSGKFTDANLSIAAAKGMKPFVWKPGTENKGNLKGTYRTLMDTMEVFVGIVRNRCL